MYIVYLLADGAEVGVEAALEAEEQLDVVVRHRLEGDVDGRHVERDGLQPTKSNHATKERSREAGGEGPGRRDETQKKEQRYDNSSSVKFKFQETIFPKHRLNGRRR